MQVERQVLLYYYDCVSFHLLPLPALVVGGLVVEHANAVGQVLPRMIMIFKK